MIDPYGELKIIPPVIASFIFQPGLICYDPPGIDGTIPITGSVRKGTQ